MSRRCVLRDQRYGLQVFVPATASLAAVVVSCDDNGAKGSGARACVIACPLPDFRASPQAFARQRPETVQTDAPPSSMTSPPGAGGEVRPATVAQI